MCGKEACNRREAVCTRGGNVGLNRRKSAEYPSLIK